MRSGSRSWETRCRCVLALVLVRVADAEAHCSVGARRGTTRLASTRLSKLHARSSALEMSSRPCQRSCAEGTDSWQADAHTLVVDPGKVPSWEDIEQVFALYPFALTHRPIACAGCTGAVLGATRLGPWSEARTPVELKHRISAWLPDMEIRVSWFDRCPPTRTSSSSLNNNNLDLPAVGSTAAADNDLPQLQRTRRTRKHAGLGAAHP